MRIVISGGSGLLGRALTRALRAAGHSVIVLTRRPHGVGDVHWTPETPGAWIAAVQAADAVVNLSGEGIAERRWSAERKQAIVSSRVEATRALTGALREAVEPAAVFLSGSAIGFYGNRGDEEVTELTPPGSDFLAEVCVTWEREAIVASDLTRVVLLRTGVVLAREGGALAQMALPFRFFAGGPIGSGRQYISWIHRDDWVAMVMWLLESSSLRGPVNLTAPRPERNADFARMLGRVLHRPAFLPAPAFALRLALGELADAAILGGQRVLPTVALSNGFAFRYPELEEALRAIYSA